MDVAALEHVEVLGRVVLLHEAQLHVGDALRVQPQEGRKRSLDRQRRGGDAQHLDVAAPQSLRPLIQRTGVGEQTAAVAEELLATRRDHQPPACALEQREAQIELEALICRDNAGWVMRSTCAARTTVPQSATVTHVLIRRRSISTRLCPLGMELCPNYALDRTKRVGIKTRRLTQGQLRRLGSETTWPREENRNDP